jgi:hypothetical protein
VGLGLELSFEFTKLVITRAKTTGGVAQAAQRIPSKHKTHSSNPSTTPTIKPVYYRSQQMENLDSKYGFQYVKSSSVRKHNSVAPESTFGKNIST